MVRQQQFPPHESLAVLALQHSNSGGAGGWSAIKQAKNVSRIFELQTDFVMTKKLRYVQNYVHSDDVTICYETHLWQS